MSKLDWTRRTLRTALFGSVCVASLAANAATAQEASPPSAASADSVDQSAAQQQFGLEEIVVTAQKRAENLQNVPIAVSAVSGSAIESLNAKSLQGLYGSVPTIQLNNYVNTPAVAAFYIRGMGILEADPYAGQTVSIVVDGVPQYFSMGALLDTYDLDRVEVLRGPQGTLFGANTTGGVVNIVTRQPTGEFGGRVEATYGNWNRFDALAAIDFPIVPEVLAGKIVYNHTERKGWFTNVVDGRSMGDKNHNDVRAYLKFTPSADFDATLVGEYVRGRDGSPVQVNGGVPGEGLYRAAGTVYPGFAMPMYASPCTSLLVPCKAPKKYYGANNSVGDYSDLDTYAATLTMNWRNTALGDITSVTAYKKISLDEETDQDGTPEFLLDTQRISRLWQFSQELRSSVDITPDINLIYGAFYLKTGYRHLQSSLLAFAIPGVRQDNPQHQKNYALSGFAQTYVNVTDALRLQAGIRYTYEKTSMNTGTQRYAVGLGPRQWVDVIQGTFIDDAGSFLVSGSKSWNNLGWKLGFDYQIDQNKLFYAYWARGFKSGGFVGRLGIPQDLGPYDPEKVDTYEAGIKAEWFDRRLRTNLTVFYTKYRDMQLSQQYITSIPGNDYVQGNTILNVASAEIKGVEFDGSAVPFEGLTLTASAAYLDATYTNFPFLEITTLDPQGTFRDLAGYRLQNSPKWSASTGFTYKFQVGPGQMTAGATYNYTSQKFLTSQVTAPRSVIQPTHVVNANIEWSPDGGSWSIGFWGTNIFDNRYLANVYDFPGLFAFTSYAPPREYGATVKYRF